MHVTNKSLLQFLYILVLINLTSPDHKDFKAKATEEKPKVIHGRYTRDITDFHIVVPQKVHPNGSFNSHHLPHYFHPSVRKKRNLEDERIHYLLHFGGLSHMLELEPNAHITSPGMLVETRAKGSDISGVTFRRPRRHLCHFHGSVRGSPGSRVALSSCDGLVGMIRTASGMFFVEPLHGESPEEGKEHIHVVYKRSVQPTGRSCNVRGDDWWNIWTTRLRKYIDSHPVRKRSEAGVSVQRWYELMIATDKKFLTFHKDIDVEEYVICIMNMVADYYHDKSVGNLIDIVIVRIIYLEKQEEEIDLETSTSGESTLDSFCIWQAKMNPKDHFHPNHHDLGVLLTRYDICSADEDGCNLLGLAHMGTACTNDLNCCINEDSGLILGITATHEIGHTLSCTHDAPDESGCDPVTEAGDSTIMNPAVQFETSAWSPCSRGFITGLFDSQMGECMLDEPKEHTYPLDEMPPGAFYDADEQCAFLFGSKYVHYEQGGDKMCDKLWCKEKDGGKTMSFGSPPAEGTKCGTDKWCYNKTCVMIGARPQAINGEWGEWAKWSTCSRTCGGGVEVRERLCDSPQPSNKGRYCSGKRSEYNMCNTQDCGADGGPTFRELQCTEFDKKPFEGVLHTWKPYKAPDSDPNPCALYCLSSSGLYTKLAPRVKDGTRCKGGTRDTCIQGACMPVGCDWKIASEAVEDVCGVCDGDGTHCTVVEDVFKGVPTTGYAAIATVPKGATNVKLAEVHPSDNMIAVSAIDNQTYYLNGGYTEGFEGEYSFGNTKGIYTKPGKDMDELNIKGPLTEPLVLYVCLFADTNPGVHYSYAMPSDKPTYTPKYRWDFVEWGPCSAQCGGGTQVMIGVCMEEKNGKVKPSLCESIPKKEPRARTCNDKPCRTRWKVWKWGPCSGCLYQSGTRTRQVECVKENPTNTGDEEIITEATECCGDPPKKSELCNSSRPCPKNMTSGIVKKREMEVMPIEEMIVKRDNGKSFNDGANASRANATIQDHVQPSQVHLEEVILEDSKLNLTEKEFEEVGDKLSEKRLSCPLQTLTGQDAMDRIEQLIHGEDYVRNKTKSNNGHKEISKSSNSSSAKIQESPHHEEDLEKCLLS